jgi:archaellum biogenesis protein FlaJ (TadC family)
VGREALADAAVFLATGYTAFSVSQSELGEVKAYISNQEEHHRKRTYQEEVVALLRKHGIEFDPQFVV